MNKGDTLGNTPNGYGLTFLTQISGGDATIMNKTIGSPQFVSPTRRGTHNGMMSDPFSQPGNPFAKLLIQKDDKLIVWPIDFNNVYIQQAMSNLNYIRDDLTFLSFEDFSEKLISEDIQKLKFNFHTYDVYRKLLPFLIIRFYPVISRRKKKETHRGTEKDLEGIFGVAGL